MRQLSWTDNGPAPYYPYLDMLEVPNLHRLVSTASNKLEPVYPARSIAQDYIQPQKDAASWQMAIQGIEKIMAGRYQLSADIQSILGRIHNYESPPTARTLTTQLSPYSAPDNERMSFSTCILPPELTL